MRAQETFSKSHLVIVFLALLMITPAVPAQSIVPRTSAIREDGNDVIRVETNLVTVPASVMDREGRYVANLKKEDFQIFEAGVEQEVAFFEPVERPCTILFLLDISGSMTYKMEELARAASNFVAQLHSDDQIIVASFDDWVNVLCEATSIKDVRQGKQFRLRMGRAPVTMVYDAVDFALKRMKKIKGRKAIVLFSDGVGDGISSTAKRNLRDAEEQEALIYTIQFDTYLNYPYNTTNKKELYKLVEVASNYMRDLAQKTGGRYYQIENISDLSKTFGQVADELGRQYSLGYYTKQQLAPGQRRQIKVKVRLPNLAVRARDSYLVENR